MRATATSLLVRGESPARLVSSIREAVGWPGRPESRPAGSCWLRAEWPRNSGQSPMPSAEPASVFRCCWPPVRCRHRARGDRGGVRRCSPALAGRRGGGLGGFRQSGGAVSRPEPRAACAQRGRSRRDRAGLPAPERRAAAHHRGAARPEGLARARRRHALRQRRVRGRKLGHRQHRAPLARSPCAACPRRS